MSLPALALLAVLLPAAFPAGAIPGRMQYPETRKVAQEDTLHGVTVADPYRWLEDDIRQSAEVRQWVEAQNELTFAYLRAIPERAAIAKRLTEIWHYPKVSAPERKGGRYYTYRNDGLQNQDVLYVQTSSSTSPRS